MKDRRLYPKRRMYVDAVLTIHQRGFIDCRIAGESLRAGGVPLHVAMRLLAGRVL